MKIILIPYLIIKIGLNICSSQVYSSNSISFNYYILNKTVIKNSINSKGEFKYLSDYNPTECDLNRINQILDNYLTSNIMDGEKIHIQYLPYINKKGKIIFHCTVSQIRPSESNSRVIDNLKLNYRYVYGDVEDYFRFIVKFPEGDIQLKGF